nr:ribonuclease H-like domain-containing protein [Tanacetum cinerariifolium]
MPCVTSNDATSKAPTCAKYAIDVQPIPPHQRNNKVVHHGYLNRLRDTLDTLCKIVKEARSKRLSDNNLDYACVYTKRSQELLENMSASCPKKNTISIQDLTVKEKMKSQSETIQTVSVVKVPMLKTGDYDLWSMRIEQYLTHTDYAFWEVIMNGDAPTLIASVSGGVKAAIPLKTTKQKMARRNELKAKSNLLLAILDEHLLKFHGIKDAKTL